MMYISKRSLHVTLSLLNSCYTKQTRVLIFAGTEKKQGTKAVLTKQGQAWHNYRSEKISICIQSRMTDVETELITGQPPKCEGSTQNVYMDDDVDPGSINAFDSPRISLINQGDTESETWTERRVRINVGGRKFQTWESTLRKYPDTLLGSNQKEKYFDYNSREYFFDRDPGFFRHILNFYRKGKLHFSAEQCELPYEEELDFYRIDAEYIAPCCRDEFEPLLSRVDDDEHLESVVFPLPPKLLSGKTFRGKLHVIMRYPEVSFVGKFVFYLVASAIIVSVITTVVETVSCGEKKCAEQFPNVFKAADTICVIIFLVEFCLSLYASKDRLKHLRSLNTVVDAFAILPFFINITVEALSESSNAEVQALVILRVFRIFRVFKLMRISERLQNLAKSLRASAPDLLFLCFTIFLCVLIFSSIIFYMEQLEGNPEFTSIPAAMWFGAQTMTTLG